uniref:DUF1302 domain-containing protein n=1 Tax=Marinobacterium profundum TaxID=1714300 RepID=UPI00083571BE|nr:DUF1302 domain-containing protein [Marinobacterium profundum]
MKNNNIISVTGCSPTIKKLGLSVACSMSVLMSVPVAQAFTIDTGNPNIRLSWDNSIRYSAGWRVEDKSEDVLSSYNPNLDDGDRNFNKGLISNRMDLLSEFDLSYDRRYGVRLSGAAWYDDVYNKGTDNDGSGLSNNLNGSFDEFPDETEELHGRDAEILDAFLYGNFNVDGKSLSLKAGQYTQIYGESLFFGGNGIAGAQAPVDIVKLLSVPGSTFQEILRPVGQLGANLVINESLSVGAYYQYEWEKARLPGAGSYFSFSDFADAGGDYMYLPPALGGLSHRVGDITPSDDGQFGAQIKIKDGNYEYGLYAAQYHDKFPQFYVRPGSSEYTLVYGESIKTLGASVSTLIGEANVAAEVSVRKDMPLAGVGNVVIDVAGNGDGDKNALYPVGNTFHAQISAITLMNESPLWDGATLLGEVAYNRITSIEENRGQLDPNTTRSSAALRLLLELEYFQAMQGVDLKLPIGLGYGISGNPAIGGTGFSPEGGGDLSVGLKFDYLKTWRGGVQYTHYFGSAGGIVDSTAALSGDQVHADRDFISFNIQRSF